jgi:hypothetical protein
LTPQIAFGRFYSFLWKNVLTKWQTYILHTIMDKFLGIS